MSRAEINVWKQERGRSLLVCPFKNEEIVLEPPPPASFNKHSLVSNRSKLYHVPISKLVITEKGNELVLISLSPRGAGSVREGKDCVSTMSSVDYLGLLFIRSRR